MIPVITVEGPTASGKSTLALALAKSLGTGIISADSRQVYRLMDIGTAKPSVEERQSVPHHLIDILDISETYTAGDFREQALSICRDLYAGGKIPIVVGGTGLYIRSLLEGLFQLPDIPADIRREVLSIQKDKGNEYLHRWLQSVDAEAAANISVQDLQRTSRALEVWLATGIPITEHWRRQDREKEISPFRIMLTLERDVLYHRINTRMDAMMEQGLLEEIQTILGQGYTWHDPGLNAVGYQEFEPLFSGMESLDSCLDKAKQHSRNYAKRQITWNNKCNFDLTVHGMKINLSHILQTIEGSLPF